METKNEETLETQEEIGYNQEEQTEEQVSEEQETADYDKVFFGTEDEPEAEPDDEEEPEEGSEPEGNQEEGSEETPSEQDQDMVTLKWRGKEIQVTKQEAINMAQQNFDITHKYQEVAKMRKSAETELELLKKIKEGDKEALAQLSKQSGIDPVDLLDIDMDGIEQGTPDQVEPFVSPEVSVMMDEVAKDDTLYNELREIERVLPESVVSKMAKDPQAFYAIVNEVKSGDANKVMPHVQAQLSQLSDLDRSVVMNDSDAFASFYINVKDSLIRRSNPAQQPEVKRATPGTRVNPAKVSVNKSNTTQRRGEGSKTDAMSSDEAYNKILERLNSQA